MKNLDITNNSESLETQVENTDSNIDDEVNTSNARIESIYKSLYESIDENNVELKEKVKEIMNGHNHEKELLSYMEILNGKYGNNIDLQDLQIFSGILQIHEASISDNKDSYDFISTNNIESSNRLVTQLKGDTLVFFGSVDTLKLKDIQNSQFEGENKENNRDNMKEEFMSTTLLIPINNQNKNDYDVKKISVQEIWLDKNTDIDSNVIYNILHELSLQGGYISSSSEDEITINSENDLSKSRYNSSELYSSNMSSGYGSIISNLEVVYDGEKVSGISFNLYTPRKDG